MNDTKFLKDMSVLTRDISNSVMLTYEECHQTGNLIKFSTSNMDALYRYQLLLNQALEDHLVSEKTKKALLEHVDKHMNDIMKEYKNVMTHITEDGHNNIISSSLNQVLKKYGTPVHSLRTGLGDIYFLKDSQGEQYVVKRSVMSFHNNIIQDNPRSECRFNRIVSKDGHPNMSSCIESFALEKYYYSVFKYAAKGDLNLFLNKNPVSSYNSEIFMDILRGVEYLHNYLRIAHLDLKPHNIFIDENSRPIIGDLGVAVVVPLPTGVDPVSCPYYSHLPHEMQLCGQRVNDVNHLILNNDDTFNNIGQFYVPFRYFISHPDFSPSYIKAILRLEKGQVNGCEMNEGQSQVNYDELMNLLFSTPCEERAEMVDKYVVIPVSNAPSVFFTPFFPLSMLPSKDIIGFRGTQQYACPVFSQNHPVNPFKADIYSLGIILFTFLTGVIPYNNIESPDFHNLLKRRGVRQLLTKHCHKYTSNIDEGIIQVLEKMLDSNPSQRPWIHECVRLLDGYDLTAHRKEVRVNDLVI